MVQVRSFGKADVSVTQKDDGVSFPSYYPVYEVAASVVPDKGHASFPYIFILPRTQSHLVAHADQEWVHAVALYGK